MIASSLGKMPTTSVRRLISPFEALERIDRVDLGLPTARYSVAGRFLRLCQAVEEQTFSNQMAGFVPDDGNGARFFQHPNIVLRLLCQHRVCAESCGEKRNRAAERTCRLLADHRRFAFTEAWQLFTGVPLPRAASPLPGEPLAAGEHPNIR
jgi:hypothetical protein